MFLRFIGWTWRHWSSVARGNYKLIKRSERHHDSQILEYVPSYMENTLLSFIETMFIGVSYGIEEKWKNKFFKLRASANVRRGDEMMIQINLFSSYASFKAEK